MESPIDNCFELHNVPHSEVHSFSGILDCLGQKLKNKSLGPKSGYLRSKLRFDGSSFFSIKHMKRDKYS